MIGSPIFPKCKQERETILEAIVQCLRVSDVWDYVEYMSCTRRVLLKVENNIRNICNALSHFKIEVVLFILFKYFDFIDKLYWKTFSVSVVLHVK